MKTIVAVRGVGSCGKTTSIKRVPELLRRAHPDATVEWFVNGVEIKVIITINGALVGIESQGDPNSRLPRSLDYFVKVGCEVIVCATRSRGGTVDAVSALADKYQIQWLIKHRGERAEAQEIDNEETANQIVGAVNAALSQRSRSDLALMAAE
jgi:hypothetical protein